MAATEKTREVLPPRLSSRDADMARAAQGCIMAALDHARAATITVTAPTASIRPSTFLPRR